MEVAILLATYNSQEHLTDLLKSLEKQSFQDFALYVHDDGSNDETVAMLNNYSNTTGMEIHILTYPPTGSAKANFVSMLHFIDEPYMMFCDHDDVWLDDKIEKSLEMIKSIEEDDLPALIFTDLRVVDELLNTISDSFMKYSGLSPNRTKLENLLLENVAPGCTMMANKRLYSIARELKHPDNIMMHDHWMMLVASCVGKIGYIGEPLILYRQHSDNSIGAVRNRSFFYRTLQVLSKYKSGVFFNDNKKWFELRRKQAMELSYINELMPDQKEMCEEFSRLGEDNKIDRIRFYLSKKILKKKYNIWFLIRC